MRGGRFLGMKKLMRYCREKCVVPAGICLLVLGGGLLLSSCGESAPNVADESPAGVEPSKPALLNVTQEEAAKMVLTGDVDSHTTYNAVCHCISVNDLPRLHLYITAGVPVDYTLYHRDSTYLVKALLAHRDEIAKYLIDKGAALSTKTKNGADSVLDALLATHNTHMLRHAVSKGLELHPDCLNEMMQAIVKQDAAAVRKLLKQNADLAKCACPQSSLPLHWADSAEIAQLLIEHGADINETSDCGESPIYLAARRGNTEVVKLLLDKGADFEDGPFWVMLPVHAAAYGGHAEVLKSLLAKGGDPGCRNDMGNTPLHLACRSGHYAAARVLLESWAGARAKNKLGVTPLHMVAAYNHVALAELLLKYHACVVAADRDGEHPLHYAARRGYAEMVSLLLRAEADANKANNQGETPLHLAAYHGHGSTVACLLQAGAVPSVYNKDGDSPLYYAIKSGSVECVCQLVKGGADTAAVGSDYSAITLAVELSKSEIVQALIQAGVDVHKADKAGRTACMLTWSVKMQKLLSQAGGEVNSDAFRKEMGTTLLHMSIESNDAEWCKNLLSRGADVLAGDKYNDTPMHSACLRGNMEMVKLLKNKGANLTDANSNGNTPLHYAVKSGNTELVGYLLDNGVKIHIKNHLSRTPVFHAAMAGNLDMMRFLMKKGAKIKGKDKLGNSLLHAAVSGKNADIIKLCLKKGLNVNLANTEGKTPLYLAVESGSLDVAKLLVANGANATCRDNNGKGVLHVAADKVDKQMLEFLLTLKGIQVNWKDNQGNTALHYAALHNRTSLCGMLIRRGADPDIRNAQNKCPGDYISRWNRHDYDRAVQEGCDESFARWEPSDVSTEWKDLSWERTVDFYRGHRSVKFQFARGNHKLCISRVRFEVNGAIVADIKQDGSTGDSSSGNVYTYKLPDNLNGSDTCVMYATIRSDGGNISYGKIFLTK